MGERGERLPDVLVQFAYPGGAEHGFHSHCALRHSGSAAFSLHLPTAVTLTLRLRASLPIEIVTQPCATSGARCG